MPSASESSVSGHSGGMSASSFLSIGSVESASGVSGVSCQARRDSSSASLAAFCSGVHAPVIRARRASSSRRFSAPRVFEGFSVSRHSPSVPRSMETARGVKAFAASISRSS